MIYVLLVIICLLITALSTGAVYMNYQLSKQRNEIESSIKKSQEIIKKAEKEKNEIKKTMHTDSPIDNFNASLDVLRKLKK